MDHLSGVVRVNADVFRRQIGSQKTDRGAASTQKNANFAARLGQGFMRPLLVKGAPHAVAADHLIADLDADPRPGQPQPPTCRRQPECVPSSDPLPPTRSSLIMSARRSGHVPGFVAVLGLLYRKMNYVLHAFAVKDYLFGQRLTNLQETLPRISFCLRPADVTPLCPLARSRTVSLVEVSPSIEIAVEGSSLAISQAVALVLQAPRCR